MLFQFYYGGSQFSQIGYILQRYGIFDVFLPFMLVFVITYAALQQLKVFKTAINVKDPKTGEVIHENVADNKVNGVISFVIALLFIAPHITGNAGFYTNTIGFDPVLVMNQVIPHVGLIAVAITSVLIILGLLGQRSFEGYGQSAAMFIAVGLIALSFIHAANLWPALTRYLWFLNDPNLLMFLVVIVTFALIAKLMTPGHGGAPPTVTAPQTPHS